ncbi:hypothetical protein M1247_18645 [Mycobacterium sp. 21AC1]|uniref:hypothetical protein n=1 Tax=[Mycobacterium] appelbergii TaxID=2939269 RepID=UPI002939272A|nr:hypothetical protein [Mycobacterium sp. 21AC1]MDV3126948.1 hypothetical protein [Mycobacterium sp. 21AC1]
MAVPGYPVAMERQDVPDEVPIADAVEQDRDAVEPTPDEEAPEPATGMPLEATGADWQEQSETVDLDPYLEESDPGA